VLDDAVRKADVVTLVGHGERATIATQSFDVMVRGVPGIPGHLIDIE
jgi:hypothetical protein